MRCLGEQITALVDGVLPTEAREGALAHIAVCLTCRREVELERATKSRVAGLRAPEMTDQLRATLVGLATRPIMPPARPSAPVSTPVLRPAVAAFAPVPVARWPRVAATGLMAVGLGAALTLSISRPDSGPGGGSGHVVIPSSYVASHDSSSAGFLDPATPFVETVSYP